MSTVDAAPVVGPEVPPPVPLAEQLRLKGNEAFKKGELDAADQLYTQAIEAAPAADGPADVAKPEAEAAATPGAAEPPVPPTEAAAEPASGYDKLHILYSNRSVVRFGQNRYEDSLADARESRRVKPDWVKAYHRESLAACMLKRYQEGCDAYREALKCNAGSEKSTQWLKRQLRRVHLKYPPASQAEFSLMFKEELDTRMRLATLAFLWNRSKRGERLLLLHRFLGLVGGSSTTDGPQFTKEQMVRLPLQNYDDLTIPTHWVQWYEHVESKDKVKLMEGLWRTCSETEKGMIVKDLQHFFSGAAAGTS